MASRARRSSRLDLGVDASSVLRPEEAGRLHDLRDLERVRCALCHAWIEPSSDEPTTVRVTEADDGIAVHFTHAACGPSRANLARLAVLAEAEPLGIRYAQALHPEAGSVLAWERKLDLRVRDVAGHEHLYLDADRWVGFHPALLEEPVRLLVEWRLGGDGEDLVLYHGELEVERFHDALARPPAGWLPALEESGFCLLIVGAGIGLDHPGATAIQRAIREHRALMGLAEYDV